MIRQDRADNTGLRRTARALSVLFMLLFVSLPNIAAAQQITFTSASASWRNPQDNVPGSQAGDPVITNGVPTSSISWGGSTPQSGYDVTITIRTPSSSRSRTSRTGTSRCRIRP